ncbi:MAG: hypothetical protein NZ900_05285 [Synergistetes bacterium]|nr:hypothetical protein [Synergistota bacterium]MDW8192332.1 hypothetical protein [Synergistota bacterium]
MSLESNWKGSERNRYILELLEREYVLGFNRIFRDVLNRDLNSDEAEVLKKALLSLTDGGKEEEVF